MPVRSRYAREGGRSRRALPLVAPEDATATTTDEDGDAIEAFVWGMYGGRFFCRVAIFNALGIIEDSCLEPHAA